MNYLSRKHEYEADAFAVETMVHATGTESANAMILALKHLAVANLGNLTPHPLNVVLNYSHPPVLARIKALRSLTLGVN
jgi:STE24 endopeptidase